jgi:hypothetical protein
LLLFFRYRSIANERKNNNSPRISKPASLTTNFNIDKKTVFYENIMDGSSFFASFKSAAASSQAKEVVQFSGGTIDSFPIRGTDVSFIYF